jgi:ATP-dependent exoDNAse (exonuclease V) alpha subunit
MPQFSPHQDAALHAVGQWLKAKPGSNGTPQVFRLFGYAGTGKTTLAKYLADHADGEVKFAAFTGKAASVMRGKGCHGASTERVLEADQVLVGRNATRRAYNIRMRERRGFDGEMPSAGDKLVCLRNNRKKGLFNGGLWSVKERGARKTGIMTMRLLPDDETTTRGVKVSVRPECFTGGIEKLDWPRRKPYDEFDYGYVLTVHKAQGSQWDDVVLFDESFAFPDSRERWLYTGVTRAAKKLTVVV